MANKNAFADLFWELVNEEVKNQKVTLQSLCAHVGVKRTTFLSARSDKRELFFSTSVLILRALDIPLWKFTVQLAKKVEGKRNVTISD